MISALKFSRGTRKAGHALDRPFKAKYFNKPLWVLSPDPAMLAPPMFIDNVSNVMQPRSKLSKANEDAPATGGLKPPNDWFVHSTDARSYFTDHADRVADDHGLAAAATCHDANACGEARTVHENGFHTVVTLPSPAASSNITTPEHDAATTSCRSSFARMEALTRGVQTVDPSPEDPLLFEATHTRQHRSTPLVPPGLGITCPHHNTTNKEHSPEELFEGRRRIGDILVRCGVISASGTSSIEGAGIPRRGAVEPFPVELPSAPVIPGATVELRSSHDSPLVTALANWAAEWVHKLVLEPYVQRGHRFQYHGKQGGTSAPVALRIRRVISDICNPAQVIIHALWFIGILAGDDEYDKDKIPFLGIPIFRHLHNNGTFSAEDFMFRTFVACAMLGDKSVNDATFSTSTWSRLTHIPRAILNETETFALKGLGWNAMMTNTQWKEMIIYLRSYIKMGCQFDPFTYDEASTPGIMARLLDELVSLSYADEEYAPAKVVQPPMEIVAPQPVRHFSHWQLFDPAEWCPEGDPIVNRKPRTVGIAPGADHHTMNLKAGTTAKDLLDLILTSNIAPGLTRPQRPAGTSFYGPFGAIGARLAHTVRLAGACQNASWFPTQG